MICYTVCSVIFTFTMLHGTPPSVRIMKDKNTDEGLALDMLRIRSVVQIAVNNSVLHFVAMIPQQRIPGFPRFFSRNTKT